MTGNPDSGPWPRLRCLRAHSLRVEVDHSVQLWIESLDLCDVFLGEFQRRDRAPAQHRELFCSGKEGDRHGWDRRHYNFAECRLISPTPRSRTSLDCWAAILGREAASTDPILIPGIAGRRVLVTGAGGFIGSEMVRVLAASGAEPIILLEIAEQALFAVSAEMAARGYGDRCIPILGSVGDRALLAALFDEHHPEVVLHAAALKHVPLMERNPFAAVATNGIATWRLAKIAAEHRVRQMILVSTDKAVAPHSIMGASKRIAELAVLAHPEFATAVRLVNVIGSPGSVVPLFAEQISCWWSGHRHASSCQPFLHHPA